MTPSISKSDLNTALKNILFKASGGISNMAEDEIQAIKLSFDKHVIGEDEIPEKYDKTLPRELRDIKLEERRWLNMRNALRSEQRQALFNGEGKS